MRPFWLAVLLLAAPLAYAEENPHLARARAELNDLRYDKAKETLEQALKWGRSSPAETAEIYRLSGEVSAAFGDAKKAEDSFARLLSIDPSVRLAAGVSPRISGPFNAALKSTKGPIKLHHESRTGDAPTVTLVVDADPYNLVKGAQASFDGPGGKDTVTEKGKGRIELKLPPAARVTLTLAALDEHGNRLAELGDDEPIVIEEKASGGGGDVGGEIGGGGGDGGDGGDGGGADTGGDSKPIYKRWYLWGGLAVGFAAAGTYFGLQAMSAEDDIAKLNEETQMMPFSHDFSEAKEIEDRAKRNALLANVNFAAAGVFAIVGTIFLVTDLSADDGMEGTAVAPVPLPGGAGISYSGEF